MCKKWAVHGWNMRRRCNGRLLFSVVSSKKMWMNGRQRKKIDQALVQEHHIICHELMSPQPDQNKHVHCVFKCVSCTNSSIRIAMRCNHALQFLIDEFVHYTHLNLFGNEFATTSMNEVQSRVYMRWKVMQSSYNI